MARQLEDWLQSYVEYASVTEAPKKLHFWAGVSAIAGALRRKVWIDMKRFTWFPSFYIIVVAHPGVIAKSTNVDTAMSILKKVEGINFGPDIVTTAMVAKLFAACTESFAYGDEFRPMSAMTLVARELGNLIDPSNSQMLTFYIDLWDGAKSIEKATKHNGSDSIEAPWVNMIGCTTENWIASNMSGTSVGGGFASRCLFVHIDKKVRNIAYVDEHLSDLDTAMADALANDLTHIAHNLCGPYTISKEAREWGNRWYDLYCDVTIPAMTDQFMQNFSARRWTYMHKTAMVISAARSDERIISSHDLQLADSMISDLEPDMMKVFSQIGLSKESIDVSRLADFIKKRKTVRLEEAYKFIHAAFPDCRDFEGVLHGLTRSGQVSVEANGLESFVHYTGL